MPILKVDAAACQGYASCVIAADDYFDIDDDGLVVLLSVEVPETDRERVERAAHSCPAAALRLEDA